MIDFSRDLPSRIKIDGVVHDINMSFGNVVLIFNVLKDDELSDLEQIDVCFQLLLGKDFDLSLDDKFKIFEKIYKDYICFDDIDTNEYDLLGNVMPNIKKDAEKKHLDINLDAGYIYSSFMYDYGIDLFDVKDKMHWWKFKSLLNGLSDDTKLKKVIEIRQMELPKDPKQRKKVIELKNIYRL